MWNAKQIGIALIGLVLMVLVCLFPIVSRTGLCEQDYTYIYIGNYFALNAVPDKSTDIVWITLLLQLAIIGMVTVALDLTSPSHRDSYQPPVYADEIARLLKTG